MMNDPMNRMAQVNSILEKGQYRDAATTFEELQQSDEAYDDVESVCESLDLDSFDKKNRRLILDIDEEQCDPGNRNPMPPRLRVADALQQQLGLPDPCQGWGTAMAAGIYSNDQQEIANGLAYVRMQRTGSPLIPEAEESEQEVRGTIASMGARRGPQRVERAIFGAADRLQE
jgi:hypothetical protein